MINVYAGVVKYAMGEPWLTAAAELASHPETGLFMRKGTYSIVAIGANYNYPDTKLAFTASNGVLVVAGEDFARFQHEDTSHTLWRVEALQKDNNAA